MRMSRAASQRDSETTPGPRAGRVPYAAPGPARPGRPRLARAAEGRATQALGRAPHAPLFDEPARPVRYVPAAIAASHRIFRAFLTLGLVVALVAAAGVWVRTECAQNAYALSKMKIELATERQHSEALRVRMLAMGAPGRIESIASRRLAMVEPEQITFLRRRLPAQEAAPRREAPRRRPGALAEAGRWLARSAQDFTILSLGELGLPSPVR